MKSMIHIDEDISKWSPLGGTDFLKFLWEKIQICMQEKYKNIKANYLCKCSM